VHEGVSREWLPALQQPSKYAQWIVMSPISNGDPVYSAIKVRHPALLKDYRVVYQDSHAIIYELDSSREIAQKTGDTRHAD